MSLPNQLGGVIHTYQKFDPVNFPSPTAEPPDMVSPAFEHMLAYGSMREYSEEQLANAIHLDPSQIANLGPSVDALMEILKERKRKILETYETNTVQMDIRKQYFDQASSMKPPGNLHKQFKNAVRDEQIQDLETLWYQSGDERGPFAKDLLRLSDRLGEKYQIDELAGKYDFTGRIGMDVPKALEIKEELETIDKLLKQLEEAAKTAQLAVIDMEELSRFVEPEDVENLSSLQQQVQDLLREIAERQGIEQGKSGNFELTPKAYRLFQSKLLTEIFNELEASRTGRHEDGILGEGPIESQKTKGFEFGDSVAHMDVPASMLNAIARTGGQTPLRMKPDDIVIHKTRNNPKCATCVLLDMSGSMRYAGLYVDVKRMGIALDGLIHKEYPGDFVQFIEMFTFAKPRHISEIASIMPKPVTIFNNIVRLKADMADPDLSESRIPPHFTNIQHALSLARKQLAAQDTPNKQIILITDGLPTAHFEGSMLYLLYPPDIQTEQATLREAALCARDGITINIFLLQSWSQSHEDIRFAYKMAESTKGRVIFTAGKHLDRFVIWDYIKRRKRIIA